jgi:hypothetical protein
VPLMTAAWRWIGKPMCAREHRGRQPDMLGLQLLLERHRVLLAQGAGGVDTAVSAAQVRQSLRSLGKAEQDAMEREVRDVIRDRLPAAQPNHVGQARGDAVEDEDADPVGPVSPVVDTGKRQDCPPRTQKP